MTIVGPLEPAWPLKKISGPSRDGLLQLMVCAVTGPVRPALPVRLIWAVAGPLLGAADGRVDVSAEDIAGDGVTCDDVGGAVEPSVGAELDDGEPAPPHPATARIMRASTAYRGA